MKININIVTYIYRLNYNILRLDKKKKKNTIFQNLNTKNLKNKKKY